MSVLQIYAVLVSAKKHQKYSSKHQVSAADLRSTSFCKEAPKAQFQAPKVPKTPVLSPQVGLVGSPWWSHEKFLHQECSERMQNGHFA